jgi:DNA recombination protein RmuC
LEANLDVATGIIIVIVGCALGGLVVWWERSREVNRLAALFADQKLLLDEAKAAVGTQVAEVDKWRARAEQAGQTAATEKVKADRTGQLQRDLDAANGLVTKLSADIAGAQATAREQSIAAAKQIEALTQLRAEMLQDFQHLAGQALKANEDSFLKLANATFEKHQIAAVADVEKRQEAISTMLKPVAETLVRYEKGLSEIEKARLESYGNLTSELKNVIETQIAVRSETSKLVNALRAAPKTRGRWGEETLRNVMEMSGMSEYCDFTTEATFDRDEARFRPDVIIRLPGQRFIVVDAKTSTSAYMDAVDAVDDVQREAHLALHAKQLRTHMKLLSAKLYWDGLTVTPDFVAMFVAGDNFFSAALERDPELFADAVAGRVLIVTPTTLIALAKAVAFGWRQERVAENAAKVAELGRDLYKRLATMGDKLVSMGSSLESSVKFYNEFVGSLEGSVMPQARRFNELQVEGTAKPLPELKLIETDLREVRADRDLIIGPQAAPASAA